MDLLHDTLVKINTRLDQLELALTEITRRIEQTDRRIYEVIDRAKALQATAFERILKRIVNKINSHWDSNLAPVAFSTLSRLYNRRLGGRELDDVITNDLNKQLYIMESYTNARFVFPRAAYEQLSDDAQDHYREFGMSDAMKIRARERRKQTAQILMNDIDKRPSDPSDLRVALGGNPLD